MASPSRPPTNSGWEFRDHLARHRALWALFVPITPPLLGRAFGLRRGPRRNGVRPSPRTSRPAAPGAHPCHQGGSPGAAKRGSGVDLTPPRSASRILEELEARTKTEPGTLRRSKSFCSTPSLCLGNHVFEPLQRFFLLGDRQLGHQQNDLSESVGCGVKVGHRKTERFCQSF